MGDHSRWNVGYDSTFVMVQASLVCLHQAHPHRAPANLQVSINGCVARAGLRIPGPILHLRGRQAGGIHQTWAEAEASHSRAKTRGRQRVDTAGRQTPFVIYVSSPPKNNFG